MIRSTFGNMFRPRFLQQEAAPGVINLDFSRVYTEPVSVADSSLSVMVVDPSSFSAAYDYSLCDALSQAGCRVTLAQDGGLGAPPSQDRTFSLWRNFYRRRYGSRSLAAKVMKGADHFLGMRRFARECETVQPDVIHFQWLPLPFIDKLYLSRLEKVAPLVLTLHNTTLFHGSPTSRLQGFGFESVFKHFGAVLVHTEFSRKKILEKGWCAPEKIHVIPHGVLECHQGTASVPSTGTGQEQKLLFFGHVRVYKGVDLLIRAFARLPPDLLATTRLVIAGKPGMDASELQLLAQTLGVNGRIEWHLRFVPDEEIPEFFSQASMVVLPYRDIDQSGVLMTAIAFEKPIVASRIGGIPEVIQDGIHGRLVQPGDINGLAAALAELLCNPGRREAMQKALGVLRTGPLAWESCANRTIGVYHQLKHH
jgi:glycosyltransferase involved in cell wall biosynthesis